MTHAPEFHLTVSFARLHAGELDTWIEQRRAPEILLDAKALEHFTEQDYTDVAARLNAAGLPCSFHGPFVDLSPGSSDPGILEVTRHRLAQVLTPAAILRPRSVVCHVGYDPLRHVWRRERWLEIAAETWSWLAARLDELGSRLMLENVLEHTPEDLAPLFASLAGQPLGWCLDVGHVAVFGQAPMADWIARLGPALGQLHLHDNHGAWDEHLPPGQGDIDFAATFAALASCPPPRTVTLEVPLDQFAVAAAYVTPRWPWKAEE